MKFRCVKLLVYMFHSIIQDLNHFLSLYIDPLENACALRTNIVAKIIRGVDLKISPFLIIIMRAATPPPIVNNV